MTPDAIHRLMARFDPDDGVLLQWLAPHVTDRMLREIAECDYGFDANLNFERLVQIRDTGRVSAPLDWNPKEVLELTRWREPRDPALWHSVPASIERYRCEHLQRAFACAALVRANSDPASADSITSEEATLAQLVESVTEIGSDALRPAQRALAHAALSDTRAQGDERVFVALGLLLLTLPDGEFASDDVRIAGVLDWIEVERQGHWMNREFGGYSVLALANSLRPSTWRRLARTILIDPFVGTAAVHAPDGRLMEAARPPWRTSPVADRLVALGRSIVEARQTDV